MDSVQPEAFDTERQMRMAKDMSPEMTLGEVLLRRLDSIDETMRRLCWEKDLLLVSVHAIMKHMQMGAEAQKLQDAIDQLFAERSAAAAERVAMRERDTQPPEAP